VIVKLNQSQKVVAESKLQQLGLELLVLAVWGAFLFAEGEFLLLCLKFLKFHLLGNYRSS
jgi:hypothetical protein